MATLSSAVFCVTSLLLGVSASSSKRDFFTAAVFEHAPFGSRTDSPRLIVQTNLEYYRRAATIAKSKGADVIVYPEYGIILPGSRQQLKPFLETVPDPDLTRTNPCFQAELYKERPILYTLSCIARNNSLVVVANMGNTVDCLGQSSCPPDGVFQYNTNLVFDRDGVLLVRYHKEHLFYELGMDLPLEQQIPVFETDFGTFATFVCFDSIFGRMSEVARWPNVEGVFFSTMWFNTFPQLNSIQYWEAWSLGNKVHLLAANIQIPVEAAVGSGVFHGKNGALAYTFNPDGVSKLLVSNVPKQYSGLALNASISAINATSTWEWKDDGKDVPATCPSDRQMPSSYPCKKVKMDNYTFVKLTEPSGNIEACNNGMCCSLAYSTRGMIENFYLGVYNGTFSDSNKYSWCEENCIVTRCDPQAGSLCATFPLRSETIFRSVQLTANFTTDFVFPSVLSSGMRLVPHQEWSFTESQGGMSRSVLFENEDGRSLLDVGLNGRCFDKDPPYIR